MRPTPIILMMAAVVPLVRATDWRDVFREYERSRLAGESFAKEFPGFDAEMARMGAAFAAKAYPDNPELGRKNFRRLALRLRLSTPNDYARRMIFTPAEQPWPEYDGKTARSGLAHFLVNHGTLPMPLLNHPLFGVIRQHPIRRDRILPASACAARTLRLENADMMLIEHDAEARRALLKKIRAAFDAENPKEPLTDKEAECMEACLTYMA